MALKLANFALRDGVASVTVNGKSRNRPGLKTNLGATARCREWSAADKLEIVVNWKGEYAVQPNIRAGSRASRVGKNRGFDWNKKISAGEKLEAVNLAPFFNDNVTQIFRNDYRSPRSPFASLASPKQGIGGWCEPNASFDVDDAGLRSLAAKNGGKIILPDGISFATPGEQRRKKHHFHVAMGQLSARSFRSAGGKIIAHLSAHGRFDGRAAKPV